MRSNVGLLLLGAAGVGVALYAVSQRQKSGKQVVPLPPASGPSPQANGQAWQTGHDHGADAQARDPLGPLAVPAPPYTVDPGLAGWQQGVSDVRHLALSVLRGHSDAMTRGWHAGASAALPVVRASGGGVSHPPAPFVEDPASPEEIAWQVGWQDGVAWVFAHRDDLQGLGQQAYIDDVIPYNPDGSPTSALDVRAHGVAAGG